VADGRSGIARCHGGARASLLATARAYAAEARGAGDFADARGARSRFVALDWWRSSWSSACRWSGGDASRFLAAHSAAVRSCCVLLTLVSGSSGVGERARSLQEHAPCGRAGDRRGALAAAPEPCCHPRVGERRLAPLRRMLPGLGERFGAW
jgi:hypothetical protein